MRHSSRFAACAWRARCRASSSTTTSRSAIASSCRPSWKNRSLFEILKDEGGRSVCGFEDRFRIARADAESAELLGVAEGEPLLEVLETVYGDDATDIIYVNRQLIASERYLYVVRSRKG